MCKCVKLLFTQVYTRSPLLDCFWAGSGVQLKSKAAGGMLRIRPDGSFDCRGEWGNDFSAHFLVTSRVGSMVMLRSGANPAHNLTVENGQLCARPIGTYFNLHETEDHYVTLQHDISKIFVAFDGNGNLSAARMDSANLENLFEVHLAYSPHNHVYEPTH